MMNILRKLIREKYDFRVNVEKFLKCLMEI